MNFAMIPIKAVELHVTAEPWPFAIAESSRIAAHWQQAIASNPGIWNGRVLIGRQAAIAGGVLRGTLAITDYASFIAWRNLPHRDASWHIFGMPGIVTSDAAIVFGIMANHTLNAGKIYPPGGSLEPRDVCDDGRVDVLGSIARELLEETGLAVTDGMQMGLYAIPLERNITVISMLQFPWTADELERRVNGHIRKQENPELDGLWTVRSETDIRAEMPAFTLELISYFFAHRSRLTVSR
jgi:8-oxo-dGTP pyrophosphatase MutT (NUDIX family)